MDNGVACASCGLQRLSDVVLIEELPVHVGVLWASEEAARSCATGDMRLQYCPSCGLLTNTAFDPDLLDYTLDYDNSLHASGVFRDFESALVEDLVRRHQLEGKRIVEIGGGAGRFLELLSAEGGNTGIGFDPSIGADRTSADGRVSVRAEYFTASTRLDPFDLLCCRQVLEHVPDLHGFLGPIVSAMEHQGDAVAYFDVPNSTMLLADLSIWDLVYEHCHYFVAESLTTLMTSAGLPPERTWTAFEDQFLSMEVGVGTDPPVHPSWGAGHLAGLTELVEAFAGHVESRRMEWTERLQEEEAVGRRVAVWGAGARAVSFFSMLGITDEVAYLVDANPRKQGTFLAGTGHGIHAPQRLAENPVDVVVLLNGIYREEIAAQLGMMDLDPTLVVV